MTLAVIVLAAGRGQRMRSAKPKVLHELAGRPLLQHVLSVARSLVPNKLFVVLNPEQDLVAQACAAPDITWCWQHTPQGTGDAVKQVLSQLATSDRVLVLYGDVPLIAKDDLQALLAQNSDLTLLTADLTDPSGLGRIVRNDKSLVTGIVEERDASDEEQQIKEIFSGILAVQSHKLASWLPRLAANNAQKEYYLTDIVKMAVDEGAAVAHVKIDDPTRVQGVNDRLQLAQLERAYQRMQAEHWLRQGVSLRDPARFDVRGEVHIGQDVTIDVNVVLEGQVTLGDNVSIGPHCVLRDVTVAAGTKIAAHSLLEGAVINENCSVGPFARLRPGAYLAQGARVGNFVEIKKSNLGEGTKVNHLSYVGDSSVGAGVNIGAGTITCNYDGYKKHQTVIEDGVSVGSNTALIAPVTLGAGAVIGAGSTISKDAPKGALTLARAKQKTIETWKPKPSDES